MKYLETLPRRVVTVYIPLGVFVFVLLFPFYWMAITTFKPNDELYDFKDYSPFWVVQSDPRQHPKLLFETDYPDWLLEHDARSRSRATFLSLFAACSPPTRSSGCASAAPATSGWRIFLAYLVPPSILFIPLATMVFSLGLFDTRWALILTYPTFLIPFCTWLLMGYFRSIPYELEECALIDGATRSQILVKIVLPLAVPGLISAGHLRLHPVLERVHLRAHLHLVVREEDRAGGRADRAGRGRRLSLGLADGRRAARLAAGRDPLLVLRRALRLVADRRGQGVGGRQGLCGPAAGRHRNPFFMVC